MNGVDKLRIGWANGTVYVTQCPTAPSEILWQPLINPRHSNECCLKIIAGHWILAL